ncbi:MAG: peptide transporter [Ilumatobacteraceae bacterium]|nr:peptide transporter [Ilumatobacteraceae bacterium]
MIRVIVKRLLATIPLMLLITIGTFALAQLIQGNPAQAIAGDSATAEQLAKVKAELHLDDPAPIRYIRWLSDVFHGNFGMSVATHRSVSSEIARRFPVTASLAIASLILMFAIGIPLGILQGMRPGSKLDKLLLGGVSLGLAAPNFLLGTIFVYVLSVRNHWLPSMSYVGFSKSPVEWAKHMIMPALSIAIVGGAEMARQLRTGLVGVAQEDYIRAAKARGLHPARVTIKHALKNAAMPALTIVGVRVGYLLAGSVIIEQIFQFHGLGEMTLQAIQNKDFIVVQGVVLALAAIVVVTSLVVDIAYAFLNPKVRLA